MVTEGRARVAIYRLGSGARDGQAACTDDLVLFVAVRRTSRAQRENLISEGEPKTPRRFGDPTGWVELSPWGFKFSVR